MGIENKNKGRIFQVPFREVRITLPGDINSRTISVDNLPKYIEMSSSLKGTGNAVFQFINLNKDKLDHGLWELQGPVYIEAESYKSKIEIQWLLTFILGSGIIGTILTIIKNFWTSYVN